MHMERRRRIAAVSREKAAAKPKKPLTEAQKIERRKAWQFFYEKIKNNPEFVECRRSMETQRISHREAEKRCYGNVRARQVSKLKNN